ncbi:serine hydrolase [Pedobacter sp. MC2016-24]|uniref:serine hydrolase domain-containing protein n=1 Tax=Pedobacter sp. MC2016-24 TaxID=2780090 RepID=UPI0018804C0B|nr:serine hydrolase domain-containing protein [Pedobacter sp. MC2016-24]MBE9602354.1 beta-lactamase family protein [Pedobacter sp. MC2016-24]
MRVYIITFIFLSITLSSLAQQAIKIETILELTDSIQRIIRKRNIPGLMLTIVTRDRVLFAGGLGEADLESKRPVHGQTLFRMGSITKTMVAMAIMKLADMGKLDLNACLAKVAPEVPFANRWERTHPVKIINLLENTTGFDDFKWNKMYTLDRVAYSSQEMMLQQKSSMICRWRPSERYTYSNVNYAILGYIIRKISGQEYDSYLKEKILLPVGMTHSNLDAWSRHNGLDTKEYAGGFGKLREIPAVTLLPAPAGALWSCADDMAKYIQLFLHNGFPVISRQQMNALELPVSTLAAKAGLKSGYALGNEDFGHMRGHDGTMGACKSSFRYNRKSGYGFAIASNGNGLGNIENLINSFLSNKYDSHTISGPMETQPLDQSAIKPFLGYYQAEDPRYDLLAFADRLMLLKVELVNDTLQFNILGKTHQLLQQKPMVFIQKGASQAEIAFAVNAEGKRVMIINKHYTEQTSGISALGWRILILLSLLFAITAVIMGLYILLDACFKKRRQGIFLLFLLPMLDVGALCLGTYSFMIVKSESYRLYELSKPSLISISIYLGFTLFGAGALLNLWMLFNKWKAISTRFMKILLTLIAISLVFIACVLFDSGWIGLLTWKC